MARAAITRCAKGLGFMGWWDQRTDEVKRTESAVTAGPFQRLVATRRERGQARRGGRVQTKRPSAGARTERPDKDPRDVCEQPFSCFLRRGAGSRVASGRGELGIQFQGRRSRSAHV